MDAQLIALLEKKVEVLLLKYSGMRRENHALMEEVERLRKERELARARVDEILGKMEGLDV
jgi:cell division protein ZapB